MLVAAALPPVADALLGALPETDGCRVLHVIDGDTLDLRCPGEGLIRARPTGFDAPELFSPGCGSEALAALEAQTYLRWTLAGAGKLAILPGGTDRYGRRLVEIEVDGERLADRMVASGHARSYDGGARKPWCTASK